MQIDKSTGLLLDADFIASPNYDERPIEGDISLLVVHNISLPPGQFGTGNVTELFTNCLDCSAHPYFEQLEGLEVSSHLLIERSGRVVQFVPFHQRAWHAGVSNYGGRERCNDFSIGIELEGTDDIAYEDIQYQKLFAIMEALFDTYPGMSASDIAGHSDIAPGRKTDPGPAFDWARVKQYIKGKTV